MYHIWRIYLDLWGHDCKKWVWPTFGCKLGQSDPIVMQLKLDMSCHLLNIYTKFQIDISKHVEKKSGKHGRTDGRTDGQTDGRTDKRTDGRTLPRHNTSRFSNGRIKNAPILFYKNFTGVPDVSYYLEYRKTFVCKKRLSRLKIKDACLKDLSVWYHCRRIYICQFITHKWLDWRCTIWKSMAILTLEDFLSKLDN